MAKRVHNRSLVRAIEQIVSPDFSPAPLRRVAATALRTKYSFSIEYCEEYADKNFSEIRDEIRQREFAAANDYFGYFYHLKINELNEEYVQGACFVQKSDSPQVAQAKKRRSRFARLAQYIEFLSPEEFEHFCGRILKLIGVRAPVVSKSSGDQGIDFFGRWHLDDNFANANFPSGVERQLRVWLVGQAKKYGTTKIGTDIVRELVGSIELAKAKAFSSNVDEYASLNMAYCDPVFYCLFITGSITSGTANLLTQAGVIFFDRDLLSVFIADNVDETTCSFSTETEFRTWLSA